MLIKALSAKTQRAFAPNASSVCPVCIMHPAQMDDAFCKSVTSTVNSKITITMKATPNKGMKLSAEDVRACLQHRLHRSLNYIPHAALPLHLSEPLEKRGTLPSHASQGAGLLQGGRGGGGDRK